MSKAAAMLEHGASAAEVLRHFLPNGKLAKFDPHYLGPGPGGGQFTTAEMDGTSSGDASTRGLRHEIERGRNSRTGGGEQENAGLASTQGCQFAQCETMRLAGAGGNELPHSSQWKEGDPVTPESVKDLCLGPLSPPSRTAATAMSATETMRRFF